MDDEGYGEGYQYDHDAPDGFSGQNYFPEAWAASSSTIRPNAASNARSASGWRIGKGSGGSGGGAESAAR